MPNTTYLIDASPYIFRAFFSIDADMVTPEGKPVNATYGFARFLLKLVDDTQATDVAVCFDRNLSSSFRNEIYPPYKAQRELPPEDLKNQIDWCVEMSEAFGMATYIDDRYEADDLIAGLHRHLHADPESEIVIVTSDKDMAQLVDERVSLWDLARDERYGPDEVVAKFGVKPAQIVDYLGLAGDSVDNIPGVRGVGKKTASALLAAFADLDALYDDLDAVADLPIRGARTLGGKLAAQRDEAYLSRQLATVANDKPATLEAGALRYRGAERSTLEPLATRLGLERLIERVERWADET